MKCPVGLIKNTLKTLEWPEFTEKIVKGDGKGILFQEKSKSNNDDPDLFFTTKHPVIAEALTKTILKNSEKNALYKSIFSSMTLSNFNATFVVDLIKNLKSQDSDLTSGQIDNYYELAKLEFESSAHFILSYVTNIEKKTNNVSSLRECIRDIEIIEASKNIGSTRNHRLIHRKGSINFKIARVLHKEKADNTEIENYLKVAEEWFDIKKHLDPSSPYSYIDYFNLLLWKLKYWKYDVDEKLDLLLKTNVLFEEAYRVLYADTSIINDLFEEFSSYYEGDNDIEYLDFLLDRYQDVHSRPVACILLYYYYSQNVDEPQKCQDLLNEIKNYTDNKDVVYFLFKYYGRNLHDVSNRLKFFEIIRYNEFLKEKSAFRFYYFSSICEFYDYRWHDGKQLLNELRSIRQVSLNPDFFLYWQDAYGNDQIFEGEVVLDNKIKMAKIEKPFFRQFTLVSGNYSKLKEHDPIKVKLRFLFEGVRAELINIK